jgi:hypothetical protein
MPWVPYWQRTDGELAKPWVQITLWRDRGTPRARSVSLPAILDSGADYTVINADYAWRLGLDLNVDADVTPAVVMGGGLVDCSIVRGLELEFAGEVFPFDAYFVSAATRSIPKDDPNPPSEDESVVGREGFFARYLIAFDHANARFFVGRPSEIPELFPPGGP